MKKRTLTLQKYGISAKRYKELCGFCEQYPEWKEELLELEPSPKPQRVDGMPFSQTNNTTDETCDLAIKRAMLSKKIKLVEDTAKEASQEMWEYIIKSACYEQPFWYLRDIAKIPMSESAFLDRRRYFFYLLSKKR